MRDEELAELISQVRSDARGICGASKALFAPRRMGVRQAPPSGEKRAAKRESADDLVEHRFSADMAWFAGITYVKTRQGWLYLAVVMDIWLRRIVG